MSLFRTYWRNLWWVFSFIFMTACGGGGGSSGLSGSGALSIAEQVSVVDAADEADASLSAKSLGKGLGKSVSALPAGSDYNTDRGFTYVAEHSAEAFGIVNEILCYLDQAQYDSELLLNAGAYVAQIDANECRSEKSDASQAGQDSQNQTSGANAPNYEFWTFISEREEGQPHYVSLWANGDEEQIKGKAEITQAASAENPYGLFHVDFLGSSPESGEEMFHGYLQAVEGDGGILLQFLGTDKGHGGGPGGEGEDGGVQRATLNRSADGLSGSGLISMESSDGSSSQSTQIAYDADHFLRTDGDTEVCLSRTDFDTSAWRYNLYQTEDGDNPGARVSMQGGFPIKFTDDASREHHGFVGYWGLFVDGDADLETGDTVVKQSFGGGEVEETEYNVFIANGKLIKRTRETVTLSEIQGIPLDFGTCDEDGCTNYQVMWNNTENAFFKTGVRDQENWILQELDVPQELEFENDDYSFNFWSQSLGGEGRVNLPRDGEGDLDLGELTGEDEVIFFRRQTVLPGDVVPENLICFNNCPDPANIDGSDEEVYLAASTWQAAEMSYERQSQLVAPEIAEGALEEGTHFASYTFDPSEMLLKKDDVSVATSDDSESTWGVHSGVMIDPSDIGELACPWDENTTCPWRAFDNIEVSYVWETGKEQWSHLTLLQDPTDDSFLTFDQPIMVKYQDEDGKSFYLDYAGAGELHGIPGMCVDMDTGEETSCHQAHEDGKHIRWVPQFTIPDGSVVTDLASDTEYYVKALEKEQRMIAVDASECADLELADYDLPEASGWTEPDIGDEPDVTAPPSVIGGELQITE